MQPPARTGLAAAAAGLVLVTGAISPAVAQTVPADPSGTAAPAAADSPETTITLVTGDVVRIRDAGTDQETLTVDAVSGTPDSIQTMQIGDDTYVLPDAATAYVTSGALDEELFNVSDLIEYGYDDQTSGGIPVIAQYDSGQRAKPKALPGSEKIRTLSSVHGAALKTDHEKSTSFWTALTDTGKTRAAQGELGGGIDRLWLDGRVESTLDASVPLVGAPEAWAAGYDGTGATVVVLDSGIDPQHPDVADAITTTKSFVPGEEVTDVFGHGTHVAATAVGSGAASDGTHIGVAPGADLAVGKVLADSGYGQDSWIIAGMEWAAGEADADVVNMSLGDDERTDEDNVLSQSLNALSKKYDTLFVVAAGNSGATGTVTAPGTAQAALTVAATDNQDQLAYFSSRGPRGIDDGLKPDMAAPGVDITAARSQYSRGSGVLTTMSGTSMAAPHVAGAAAILAAQHPDWDAVRLKDALMSSTIPLENSAYEVGAGRLDIPATLDGIDATGSVYFGKAIWGDDDPAPATRTVTYRNDTADPVELTLTSSTSGPDGDSSLVKISDDAITVPAHGETTIDAIASFADAPAVGHHLGEVVASTADGTVVARTTTGLTREEERYDLDVTVLGTTGQPMQVEVVAYRYGGTDFIGGMTDADTGAMATERVAPGVYAVWAKVRLGSTDGTDRTFWMAEPHVAVTEADAKVMLDLRDAKPVRLETPQPSDATYQRVEWFHDSGLDSTYGTFYSALPAGPATEVWMKPIEKVGGGEFDLTARWVRTRPLLDLTAHTPRGVPLDTLYQSGSLRLDGKVDLKVVDAGAGTPDELAGIDATGKAMLLTQTPGVNAFARAAAAEAAGAELLIVANAGPGTLYDIAASAKVPVVSISAEAGDALRAADASKLRINGKAEAAPAYVYDIAHTWQGSVPVDLTVAPTEGDLGTVVDRFADATPRTVYLNRYDCPPYLTRCIGATQVVQSGREIVTHIAAAQDGIDAPMLTNAIVPSIGLDLRGVKQRLAAGDEVVIDWFGAQAPRQGEGFTRSENREELLRMNMPLASTIDGVTGTWAGAATVESRLYQGDTLLASSKSQAVSATAAVADANQKYRLETTVTVPKETWATSNRTTSTWTFGADQSRRGWLPLIGLAYDAPTALDGTVSGKGWTEFAVTAAHEADAYGAGAVTELSLEASYDEGKTWQTIDTARAGDRWEVRVKLPKSAESVSLRTSAKDDAGNTVTQEVIRAFGVR